VANAFAHDPFYSLLSFQVWNAVQFEREGQRNSISGLKVLKLRSLTSARRDAVTQITTLTRTPGRVCNRACQKARLLEKAPYFLTASARHACVLVKPAPMFRAELTFYDPTSWCSPQEVETSAISLF
jgi:hypothetical protein